MTLLRTSALFIGLAALGMACGSDSSNSPDAPVVGSGGSRSDAAVVPGTGGMTGAGGTIVPSAGGATGIIDGGVDVSSSGGAVGTLDGSAETRGTGGSDGGIDGGIDGGTGGIWSKTVHIQIINSATTGGLDVTGAAAVPYTSCK